MGELSRAEGALPLNLLYFARALRDTGMPVGPGATLDAIGAVEAVGFSSREDFRTALHAVFVKKHEHTILFDAVFDTFWKRRGLIDKLIAMMSPQAPQEKKPAKPEAGEARVAQRAQQGEGKAAAARAVNWSLTRG